MKGAAINPAAPSPNACFHLFPGPKAPDMGFIHFPKPLLKKPPRPFDLNPIEGGNILPPIIFLRKPAPNLPFL